MLMSDMYTLAIHYKNDWFNKITYTPEYLVSRVAHEISESRSKVIQLLYLPTVTNYLFSVYGAISRRQSDDETNSVLGKAMKTKGA